MAGHKNRYMYSKIVSANDYNGQIGIYRLQRYMKKILFLFAKTSEPDQTIKSVILTPLL